MSDLELVIRPFQQTGVLSTRRIVAVPPPDFVPEVAEITWGNIGQMPTALEEVQGDPFSGAFKVIDCDNKFAEKSRTTQDVRVENPDDPDTFVMVARTNKITYRGFEKPQSLPTASTDTANKSQTQYGLRAMPAGGSFGVEVDESKLCASGYKLWNDTLPGFKVGDPKTINSPPDFVKKPD